MNNISTVITPATALYLMGLLYHNARTSCVSLALLCARVSHDTLRRVLYRKVPWSRRLWETFMQGLVQTGGSLVIDDTSWERFTRVADAVSWVWSGSVGKPVGGCGWYGCCGRIGSGRPRSGYKSGGRADRRKGS
jgi:hypothetical protein